MAAVVQTAVLPRHALCAVAASMHPHLPLQGTRTPQTPAHDGGSVSGACIAALCAASAAVCYLNCQNLREQL